MTTDVLLYQGFRRREMLNYLHRLCVREHLDDLLDSVCGPCETGVARDQQRLDHLETAVGEWCRLIIDELNGIIVHAIRQDPDKPPDHQRQSQAMGLFHNPSGMARAIEKVVDRVCPAFEMNGRDAECEGLLWNVLKQHFKATMDQLDGYGGGAGTHRLKTMRRIDALRKELEEANGGPFSSLAEAAGIIHQEIVDKAIPNMPIKVETVLDYLNEVAVGQARSIEEVTDWERDEVYRFLPPDTLILLQECFDRLPRDLRQAISIKLRWEGEPAFLRDEHMKGHYGFGWETVRKRARSASGLLRDCLEI